jgi:uncharacterized protein with gpF-like domain
MVRTKLEAADIDGYEWNWIAKYEDEIVEELIEAYSAAFSSELPAIPQATVQRIASEWAKEKAATLIVNVENVTRERVRDIVSRGVSAGDSIQSLTREIRDDFIFSPKRARLVARTETAFALGQGQKGAAVADGRDEKRWTTSGGVDDVCMENEEIGWIAISDPFPSGDDTVPAHPNCRCVVRYRTKAVSEDEATTISPLSSELIQQSFARIELFRCIGCNKLLGKNVVTGTQILCRRCKTERIA